MSLLDSGALNSVIGGGGNTGGGGGGSDPALMFGCDVGAKNINEGAGTCSLEGKTLISNPQGGVFGSPNTYGLLSAPIDFLMKIAQFSFKGIADEIANMSKADPSEITGSTQLAEVAGSTTLAEINGDDKAAIIALDLSAFTKMNIEGVESSGPIVANAPAASGNQTQIG